MGIIGNNASFELAKQLPLEYPTAVDSTPAPVVPDVSFIITVKELKPCCHVPVHQCQVQ